MIWDKDSLTQKGKKKKKKSKTYRTQVMHNNALTHQQLTVA